MDELADARQIEGLKAGLEIPAKDYLKAMRIRSLVKQDSTSCSRIWMCWWRRRDTAIAPKISEPLDGRRRTAQDAASAGMSALIPAGNLAGLPALSLPCGFAEAMPVALQLVGPPFSENTLLAIGREFQNRDGLA